MNTLIARVHSENVISDGERFDRYPIIYEIHRRADSGAEVIWQCSCVFSRDARGPCTHMLALWDARVVENAEALAAGTHTVITKPHFFVELTPFGEELLRPRWAALTLSRTV